MRASKLSQPLRQPFGRNDRNQRTVLAQLRADHQSLTIALQAREQALRHAQTELREMQRLAGMGRWHYEVAAGTITVSDHLSQMLGHGAGWQPHTPAEMLACVAESDRAAAQAAFTAALRAPRRLVGELRLRTTHGHERWFLATVESEHRMRQQPVRLHGTLLDITARRVAQERAQRPVHHDDLTGVPNRAAFLTGLDQAIDLAKGRGSTLALLFIDLDGFKDVNDTLGHDAGDRLLQTIAARIRGCLRQSDQIGRLGGDEFLVLIDPVRRRRDVQTITQKILHAVSTPLNLQGLLTSVSASVGVALYPDDASHAHQLLKCADTAMYAAKHAGRNRMVAYRATRASATGPSEAVIAVETSSQALIFQPLINARTGALLGLEALARGPKTPRSHPVGLSELERACAQWLLWHRQGWGHRLTHGAPYLSLNITLAQLRAPHFLANLSGLLRQTGMPPEHVQLEFADDIRTTNPQATGHALTACAAMGVSIVLDQFGTGQATLASLRHLPINGLKIDASFMHDLAHDPRAQALVSAMIAVSQSLGATVIADGVNHATQRDILLRLGCQAQQGDCFTGPLTPAGVTAWLQHTPHDPPAAPPHHVERLAAHS